jgi:hypothetical protein
LFYLKYDPECSLPTYTDGYYDVAPHAWSDGPSKKDQQKLLSGCLEAFKILQSHGLDLVAVIGGYLRKGIMSLRWRTLRVFEMIVDRASFVGTVTADPLPSVGEVQLCATACPWRPRVATGRSALSQR